MFRAIYLDQGQLHREYRRALESAEVAVLQAHLKKIVAPDPEAEGAADVEFSQAGLAVVKIEQDWKETIARLEEHEAHAQEEQRQRFPNALRHRE